LFFVISSVVILFSTGFADVIQVQQAQESILFIMILGVVGTGIANIYSLN
jgi:hypothetical protein